MHPCPMIHHDQTWVLGHHIQPASSRGFASSSQVQDLMSSIEWERLSSELRCSELGSTLEHRSLEKTKDVARSRSVTGAWWIIVMVGWVVILLVGGFKLLLIFPRIIY